MKCAGNPFERPCTPGMRLGPNALRDELIAATKTALGPGHWVGGLANPYVFLTPEARALPADRRALLDKTIRVTLGKHAAVSEVLDTRTFATKCPEVLAHARGVPDRARLGEDVLTLVCRSWSADAGDYYVLPRPGSFFDGELVIGKGTSHGTPYTYDRTVSMLVRAPGLVEPGAAYEDPFDFSVYSALEAAFLGLDTRAPRDILEAHRARAVPSRSFGRLLGFDLAAGHGRLREQRDTACLREPGVLGRMTARTRSNTRPQVTLSSAAANHTGESHARTRLRIPSEPRVRSGPAMPCVNRSATAPDDGHVVIALSLAM